MRPGSWYFAVVAAAVRLSATPRYSFVFAAVIVSEIITARESTRGGRWSLLTSGKSLAGAVCLAELGPALPYHSVGIGMTCRISDVLSRE